MPQDVVNVSVSNQIQSTDPEVHEAQDMGQLFPQQLEWSGQRLCKVTAILYTLTYVECRAFTL